MNREWQQLGMLVAILSSGILLFVVLFPYTPTPIATTIIKTCVAILGAFGFVTASIIVITSRVSLQYADLSYLAHGYALLDLICVRLR